MSKGKKIISVIISVAFLALIFAGIFVGVKTYKENASNSKTYIVSYDTNGGSYIEDEIIKENGYAIQPDDPYKEGYIMQGWELNGEIYDFSNPVTKNIKLVAVYIKDESDLEKVTVSFDTDGGSIINDIRVTKGNRLPNISNPIKEGYVFLYWQLGGKTYDINSPIIEDIKLKAKYEKGYVVKFDSDGGSSISSITVSKNTPVSEPTSPNKDGYEFSYWQLDGKKYDFTSNVTNNILLKAKWKKSTSEEVYYTVTFDTKGGTEIEPQSIKSGKLASKPTNPTKENYIFSNWYDGDSKFDFNTKIKKDYTLIAKYIRIYTVSFDSDGGTEVEPQSIKSGKLASKPTNPKKSGYYFDGWYVGSTKFDFNTTIKKDYILKARWIPKYTVTFDTNGGSSISPKTVREGKTVSEPSPTKSGYIVDYWTLDGNKYDFNTKVTNDITLKAVWIKGYTVTFDSNGGTDVASQKVKSGSKATKPSDPTKKNYVFKEWQLNGEKYDFNTKVTKNITLKAAWTASTYKVYFKVEDETYEKRDVCANCKLGDLPDEPEKDGYTFDGWFDDDGKQYFSSTKINKKTYLYAEFTEEDYTPTKYTISFDSNGGSSVSNQVVSSGGKVTKPSDPTRSTYYFRYWTKDGVNEYDFNKSVNSSFSLLALWYKYTYTTSCGGTNCTVTIKRNGVQITDIEQLKVNGTRIDLGIEDGKFNVLSANISSVSQVDVVLSEGKTVKAYKES